MSDSEDSMELDRFVLEKCLRCSRDAASLKLLVCSVIGCPIAIHEECMSSEPEIDESGRFYCPYCAHKRALLRTERLRRKALLAKEVLSMFLMSREASILVSDEDPVRNVGGIMSEENLERQCVVGRDECGERSVDNAGDGIDKSPGGMEGPGVDAVVPESDDFHGGSPLLRKKRYKKKAQRMQVQRVIPVSIVSSSLRESSSCQTEAVEEDGEKQSGKDASKVSELDQNEKGNDSSKSSDTPELNQNEKAATSSDLRKGPESNQNEDVTTSCLDLNEVPESDHNEKATNNLPSELREIPEPSQNEKATEVLPKSRKVPDSNQNEETSSSTEPIKVPKPGSEEILFNNAKRRKINWTAEEVKMLKEGVLFFSTQVNKNLPWRKILERGSHVFHKTRTPDNLKDKWKVLCREASNQKQP